MHLVSNLNNTRPTWFRFGSTFALGALCFAGATAALAQPAHLTKGLQLVDEITAAQAVGVFTDANNVPLNRYDGSWNHATNPSFIRFLDVANNALPGNATKCAPLVTHLLKYCYNWSWYGHSFYDPILKATKKSSSPYPYQYIALLKQGKGFAAQVTRLDQTLPGDILLWWNVGSAEDDHAMIVVSFDLTQGKPYPSELADANPALAGTTFVAVRVLDSSSGVHTDDSRIVAVNGVDTQIAGVGTGTVGILVNANSEIVGTTWSLPNASYETDRATWLSGLHSRLKLQSVREAVIGRMP
jgi:hypothetical protein